MKLVLVNPFTIGSLFSYKDRLPLRMRSSLVYKYRCALCASEYVGMTTRTLGSRIDEHIGVSYRTGVRLTRPPHSAIRDHAEQCDIRVKSDQFKILNSSSNSFDLRVLESLYILKSKSVLNNQLSSYPLSIVSSG